MKNLFTNIVLLVALSIAFSTLTACTNTAGTQKGSADNSDVPSSGSNTVVTKKDDFPPAPTGIIQADIKALDGATFKLADKKGKVLLVNMWATWCGPCINEMPELIKMQDEYRDKGFEVIGLNQDDEDADLIKSFAAKKNLNYQLGWSNSALYAEFVKISRLNGIPQTILINREGQMTGVFAGGGNTVITKMKETVEITVNQ
ncbi:MAG: TlpA family protein disulfide reductase [Acidobacteriota bacterium]|nr:TlpA family protein disulfide reductase [Acidobacteriota bacterium]